MKRRKGKKRPPTVAKNCKWLVQGRDCGRKFGLFKSASAVRCAKDRYCGFEEDI